MPTPLLREHGARPTAIVVACSPWPPTTDQLPSASSSSPPRRRPPPGARAPPPELLRPPRATPSPKRRPDLRDLLPPAYLPSSPSATSSQIRAPPHAEAPRQDDAALPPLSAPITPTSSFDSSSDPAGTHHCAKFSASAVPSPASPSLRMPPAHHRLEPFVRCFPYARTPSTAVFRIAKNAKYPRRPMPSTTTTPEHEVHGYAKFLSGRVRLHPVMRRVPLSMTQTTRTCVPLPLPCTTTVDREGIGIIKYLSVTNVDHYFHDFRERLLPSTRSETYARRYTAETTARG